VYELRELRSLVPSHDFSSGQPHPHPDYPPSLQPRDYAVGSAEAAKVVAFAQGKKPGLFVSTHPGADNGPPCVTTNGIVLNGNGRTMALAYAAYAAKDYDWYREHLREHARQFGLKPEDVAAMAYAVLVRVVFLGAHSDAAKRFASAGNVAHTQAQSPLRTAASLARLVTLDLLDHLALDDETTFSAAVSGPGAAAADFRDALRSTLPPQVAPLYFDGRGMLTEAGKELARAMLLLQVLPVEVVEALAARRRGLLGALEGALPVLLALRRLDGRFDIAPQLVEAVAFLARHPDVRREGHIQDVLSQAAFAFGERESLSPAAHMLAAWLLEHESAPVRLRNGLKGIVRAARGAGGLWGDEAEPLSAIAEAIGVAVRAGAVFGRGQTAARNPARTRARQAPSGRRRSLKRAP
jgi:hypothetical protein